MRSYRLTEAAENDIDGIWEYTQSTWGSRQAAKYVRQLKKRIEFLVKHPQRGQFREDVSPGLRSFHEGRHLIMYRAGPKGLIVLRVLHDSMDVPERMSDFAEQEEDPNDRP